MEFVDKTLKNEVTERILPPDAVLIKDATQPKLKTDNIENVLKIEKELKKLRKLINAFFLEVVSVDSESIEVGSPLPNLMSFLDIFCV